MAFNTAMIANLAAPADLANTAGAAFNDVRTNARNDQLGRLAIQRQTGANQLQDMDIASEQRTLAATFAHQQAIQSALTKDQNGIPSLDAQGYISQMAQRGFGDVAMENVPKIQTALEHVRTTAEAGKQREIQDTANPALSPSGRIGMSAATAADEQVGTANKADVAKMAPLLEQQAAHLMAAYNNLDKPTFEQAQAIIEDAKAQLRGAPDHDHLDALVADPSTYNPDNFKAQIRKIADQSLAAGSQIKNQLESGKLAVKQQEADIKGQRADIYAKAVDDKAKRIDGEIKRWEDDRNAKLQIAKMTAARLENKQKSKLSDLHTMAEEIAYYRMEASPRFVTPELIDLVRQINPMWDASKYKDMQKIRSDVTSGSISKTVAALNLGLPHIRKMMDAVDGLGNTDFPAINKFVNFVKTGVGAKGVPVFEEAAQAAAAELAKIFKGGTPAMGEIQTWEKSFKPDMSPEQLKAVIRQSVEQIKDRVEDIRDRAKQAFPGVSDFARLDDEAADAAIAILGDKAGILGQKTSQGSATDVNTQTGANLYTRQIPAPAQQPPTTPQARPAPGGGKKLRFGTLGDF